jgi:hypothetical protein
MPKFLAKPDTHLASIWFTLGGSYRFTVTEGGTIGYDPTEHSIENLDFVEALSLTQEECQYFVAWLRWHNFSEKVFDRFEDEINNLGHYFAVDVKRYPKGLDGLLADIKQTRSHKPVMGRTRNMIKVENLAQQLQKLGSEKFAKKHPWIFNPKARVPQAGYVYILQSDSGFYKIGKAKNPEQRLRNFEVILPMIVKPLLLIKTDDYHGLEKELHKRFKDKRKDGEWFALHSWDIEAIRKDYADQLEKIPKRKAG